MQITDQNGALLAEQLITGVITQKGAAAGAAALVGSSIPSCNIYNEEHKR